MNIKEAEKLTGVSSRNIRFYEQKGLLKPTRNAENDYREYSDEEIQRLKLIRALRMVDMPLEQIKLIVDGELPLQTAVSQRKDELKQKIKQIETAIHFCDELSETDEQNIGEVLMRMDEPKNRKVLSKQWNFDYAEWAKKILLSLGIGLLPMLVGFLLLFPCLLAGFSDAHGYLIAFALLQYTLWSVAGYKMCKSELWPLGGLLAHVFALVMVLCGLLWPQSNVCEMVIHFSCLPLNALKSNLTGVGWEINMLSVCSCCLLVVFFLLGVGAKLLVLHLRSRSKKGSPAWVRKIKENAYVHYAIVSTGCLVLLFTFLLVPAFVLDLSPTQSPSTQWLAGQLHVTESREAVIGDNVYIIQDNTKLGTMLQHTQWERKYTRFGAGMEVATVYLNTENTCYLTIYTGDMAVLCHRDKFGSNASYYQMPDGVAETVLAWLESHPQQQ